MKFTPVAVIALAAGLCLAPSPGSALQVWPGGNLATLDGSQQAALFQELLLRYDFNTAQIVSSQAVACTAGHSPHLNIHIREDSAGELPGVVAVYVVGNTVENADILTVGPASNYSGPPTHDIHVGADRIFLFQGAHSTSPVHLRVTMDVVSH